MRVLGAVQLPIFSGVLWATPWESEFLNIQIALAVVFEPSDTTRERNCTNLVVRYSPQIISICICLPESLVRLKFPVLHCFYCFFFNIGRPYSYSLVIGLELRQHPPPDGALCLYNGHLNPAFITKDGPLRLNRLRFVWKYSLDLIRFKWGVIRHVKEFSQ